MSRHTPGDWYAYRHTHGGPPANGECYRIDIRGNPVRVDGKVYSSEPICSLYAGFVHFEGNAALIAAAPDLLAACKQALEDYQGREPPTHLINAIAKATEGG